MRLIFHVLLCGGIVLMASVVKELIHKYKTTVEQNEQWAVTSEEHRSLNARNELISHSLIEIIVLLSASDEEILKMGKKKLNQYANEMVTRMSTKVNVNNKMFQQVMGLFLTDQFESTRQLRNLHEELELIYEEDSMMEDDGTEEDEMHQMSQLLREIEDKDSSVNSLNSDLWRTISQQSMSHNFPPIHSNSRSNERTLDSLNSSKGDNPHASTVLNYLRQLSQPQTELNYLCSQLGWKFGYKQKAVENGFQVTCFADIKFKTIERQLSENFVAKNKKMGKKFASMLMLRTIYYKFPGVWDVYQGVKQQKSLTVELDPHQVLQTSQILTQQEVTQEPIKPVETNKDEEMRHYLNQVDNFKTEMNLLVQQCPGLINHPKMEKLQEGGKWKVKGEVSVKVNSKTVEYKELFSHQNSKEAEKIVAEKLIYCVYKNHPQILQKMILVKQKKGIKS